MAPLSVEDRCSLRSLASEEPLAGTASTFRHWLLLEHQGPWGRDGLVDARLPLGIGRALRALEAAVDARILLIRRTERSEGGVACFAVDAAEAWIGATQLEHIEDALALDPRDRARFRPAPGPLFVVCTHGRRDPCCAERGRPLARPTSLAMPGAVWESTHVGGDRFAGNLVAFPHGLYFGRVEPDEAAEVVHAYAEGRIGRLDRYRGRSSQPFHVQAAEIAVRERLRLERIDDLTVASERRGGDRAEVTFSTSSGSQVVRLERERGTPMRLTCHSTREEAPAAWRPSVSSTPR